MKYRSIIAIAALITSTQLAAADEKAQPAAPPCGATAQDCQIKMDEAARTISVLQVKMNDYASRWMRSEDALVTQAANVQVDQAAAEKAKAVSKPK